MTMKFKGYGEDKPYYGDGAFIVGEDYECLEMDYASYVSLPPDGLFIDDNGEHYWEELQYFEEDDE